MEASSRGLAELRVTQYPGEKNSDKVSDVQVSKEAEAIKLAKNELF